MTTILFDMDGTLSPAREPIIKDFIEILSDLTSRYTIGIVTGSGIEYVKEQAPFLFDNGDSSYGDVIIMPCNGTQLFKSQVIVNYKDEAKRVVTKISEKNLLTEIGKENYSYIIDVLLRMQKNIIHNFNIPITGNFISYRKSMINWSPIGRDSGLEERKQFEKIDKALEMRQSLKRQLDLEFKNLSCDIKVVLGGSTSFDIFPNGWDKTLALSHLEDSSDVYFFGDKCFEGGNDYELYKALNSIGEDKRAWQVATPEQCVRILKFNFLNKPI